MASARHSASRETGIRPMGEVPWGTHICVFYETASDLLETNAAYFSAGLNSNEFCIWAVSPPTTVDDARDFLRRKITGFDDRQLAGQVEIVPGYEWYLPGGDFDSQRIIVRWHEKLDEALSKGFAGMRVSGNAFWMEANDWKEFREYEYELNQSLASKKMIVICTYSLLASSAIDLLDVTNAHHFAVTRRRGEWQFIESFGWQEVREEIKRPRSGFGVPSHFPGYKVLTPRERSVLAQVVSGASSKEAAMGLGVSRRTIEFHRANILNKIGAKNTVDLLRIVLGDESPEIK